MGRQRLSATEAGENSFVRYVSARTLGMIGPEAIQARSALQAALDDEKENVRKAAATSISQITAKD